MRPGISLKFDYSIFVECNRCSCAVRNWKSLIVHLYVFAAPQQHKICSWRMHTGDESIYNAKEKAFLQIIIINTSISTVAHTNQLLFGRLTCKILINFVVDFSQRLATCLLQRCWRTPSAIAAIKHKACKSMNMIFLLFFMHVPFHPGAS